ncbi:MAG: hypothetical protein H6824_20015 [Planctomycetaceae bacterium]|nr:hypothetical protein [Planctomycetaceae bacterium]
MATQRSDQQPRRVTITCPCGKRLAVSSQHSGKRTKCPTCGEPLVIPGDALPPNDASAHPVNEAEGVRTNTLIALWSFVGIFALACIFFVVWHSHSSHQLQIASANDRISDAVVSATEWIAGKSSLDGEVVEQQLVVALQDDNATERTNGEATLAQVRERLVQLAEEARIEKSEQDATAIFEDAKMRLNEKEVERAIELLGKYVTHPHATSKAEAQLLLAEAKIAVSDMLVVEVLVDMTDEDFDRVTTTGEISDGKVRHPILVVVRSETVRRNLKKAAQRREEVRIAEEKRVETERLAMMERLRKEEERKQAEEERMQIQLLAERQAAERLRQMRENPTLAPQVEDVANFPRRYIGKFVRFKGVQVLGDIERDKYVGNLFCVPLFSSRDKYFTGSGDELIVTTSDRMAESLLNTLDDDEKFFNCDVYCEITQIMRFNQMVTHAKIYKIEVYDLGGNIGKVFNE